MKLVNHIIRRRTAHDCFGIVVNKMNNNIRVIIRNNISSYIPEIQQSMRADDTVVFN